MIIFFVFFVKTIVPSISFISDLGVRGVTSLYLFEFYNISPSLVIASTFTIWVINILIPVLMGTLVLIFLRNYILNVASQKYPYPNPFPLMGKGFYTR